VSNLNSIEQVEIQVFTIATRCTLTVLTLRIGYPSLPHYLDGKPEFGRKRKMQNATNTENKMSKDKNVERRWMRIIKEDIFL
jgi:hypothetical protein